MKKSSTPLGTHDTFKDVTAWDDETARMWIAALNLRGEMADQINLRRRLVSVAKLKPNDTAIEIGCGTGALLIDLARIVGKNGTVVGIEPQTALAEAARRQMAEENLSAKVKSEFAQAMSLENEVADACFAQTVLIHLQPNILRETLIEMRRVVKKGGRVISCDQDGDTWIIDHPDRQLTRRIIKFNSDQRYADGWTGRRLPRLFREANLENIKIEPFVHIDTDKSSYLFGMAERIACAAADVEEITKEECNQWLEQLNNLADRDNFFSSINYYICTGLRLF